jgi:hypothetical protein
VWQYELGISAREASADATWPKFGLHPLRNSEETVRIVEVSSVYQFRPHGAPVSFLAESSYVLSVVETGTSRRGKRSPAREVLIIRTRRGDGRPSPIRKLSIDWRGTGDIPARGDLWSPDTHSELSKGAP